MSPYSPHQHLFPPQGIADRRRTIDVFVERQTRLVTQGLEHLLQLPLLLAPQTQRQAVAKEDRGLQGRDIQTGKVAPSTC